ncbi:MAG: ACP S-malonyltransferase [Candidatus Hydrogenedentes bacterium]|nr:ACP S-malonyltransferase [Candidatus Hydrogenedentota bacterium]
MSVFLFPGQGSQRPGMGADFFASSTVARAVFEEAETLYGGGLLNAIFRGDGELLNHTALAQPALLTVEVAMARHLIGAGIRPSACAGHSLGEIPALVLAGVCAFSDAFQFTRERARLMSEHVPAGGMAAVLGLDAEAIERALPCGVQVANYNGPGQTIISGNEAGLNAAAEALKAAGAKRVVPLKVSGPFHSEYMRGAAQHFSAVLADVPFSNPEVTVVSSVSGQVIGSGEEARTLLGQQLFSPVRWTQAVAALPGVSAIEVGPGNVLKGLCKRIDGAPEVATTDTLDGVLAILPPL